MGTDLLFPAIRVIKMYVQKNNLQQCNKDSYRSSYE